VSEFDNNGFETTEEVTQTYTSYDAGENPSKAFAITSLVLGIVSIPFICCTWVGLVIAIAGLVFGILSITRKESGKGMAIAGIVCSSVAAVVIIILLIVAAMSPSQMSESDIEALTQQLQNLFK
jgi:membrane-bound ClpP family serine protease